ncbi:M48 family metalloprotease, partial [Acinetobacter baumannii]
MLATTPTVLIQARYSRALEQQADDFAARLLRFNGLSPALLAEALEKLAASHHDAGVGSYLSSHPAPDDRIRRLRERSAG